MPSRTSRLKGSVMLEFTLVGIPLIFALISIFEMSRGMWMYHTLASAIRDGVRFAVVHGNNCNIAPNNCAVQIRDVSQRIRDFAIGIPPEEIRNVTFTTSTRTVTCSTLAACLTGGEASLYWPAAPPDAAIDNGGAAMIGSTQISADYQFRSAIAMFWPGAGRGQNFGTFTFPASSRQMIQY